MEIDYYKLFCMKILLGEPFAYSRWGDGEWFNIAGKRGHNCDKCIYYPDLGEALKKIVSKKIPYYVGKNTNPKMFSMADAYPQDWIGTKVFVEASARGNLAPLYKALGKAYVVYIGNEDLMALPFCDGFITIPQKNVWLERDSVYQRIRSTMNVVPGHIVFGFSAGMATNVFIDTLWRKHPEHTYIDFGSVFDPYVGKKTRTYHKSILARLEKERESN